MKDKKLIILVILGIMAVFSLTYGIFKTSKVGSGRSLGMIDSGRSEKKSLVGKFISIERSFRKTKYTSWNGNPFSLQRPTQKTNITTSSKFTLTGIVWDKNNPKAIINDNILGRGAKIGTNTIVDIKQDRVILNDGTKDFELKIGQ